jgi:hypothetical protein
MHPRRFEHTRLLSAPHEVWCRLNSPRGRNPAETLMDAMARALLLPWSMKRMGALGFVLSVSILACAAEPGEDVEDQGGAASSPPPANEWIDGCDERADHHRRFLGGIFPATDENRDRWSIPAGYLAGKACEVTVVDTYTGQVRMTRRLERCPAQRGCSALLKELIAACERNSSCLRD